MLDPGPPESHVDPHVRHQTVRVSGRASGSGALRLLAAALVCGSAVLIFAVHVRPVGYLPLVVGVALAVVVDRRLGRDLGLIGLGIAIVSSISLHADLSNAGMLRFTVALGLAVLVPVLLSRRVFHDDAIHFPVRTGRRWDRWQAVYLVAVAVFAYLILPVYFLRSGVWQNWPPLDGPRRRRPAVRRRERGGDLGRAVLHLHRAGAAADALPVLAGQRPAGNACSCRSSGSWATGRGGRC